MDKNFGLKFHFGRVGKEAGGKNLGENFYLENRDQPLALVKPRKNGKIGTMSEKRMNVESFNLDHTKVQAPFVRVADRKILPGKDTLIKYDVRFCQPNKEHLEMDTVHSLEHAIAELMRNHTDKLIDFSPMGCQTGFYALTLGLESEEFMQILADTLADLPALAAVPAANETQCGWGANHSLLGAQKAGAKMLAARESWNQVFAPGTQE